MHSSCNIIVTIPSKIKNWAHFDNGKGVKLRIVVLLPVELSLTGIDQQLKLSEVIEFDDTQKIGIVKFV